MGKLYPIVILIALLLQVKSNAQTHWQQVDQHLDQYVQKGLLSPADLHWKSLSQHQSSASDLTHLYFVQLIDGIEISGTRSSVHIGAEHKALTGNNKFVLDARSKLSGGIVPSISALDAVRKASQELGILIQGSLFVEELSETADRKTVIASSGIFPGRVEAVLKFYNDRKGSLKLAWTFSLPEPDFRHSWEIYSDASTGEIILAIDEVASCFDPSILNRDELVLNYNFNPYPSEAYNFEPGCQNCYEVFPYPRESPYEGERLIVEDPSDPTASPFGWHEVYGHVIKETQGNNADVHKELGEYNIPYRANGGQSLDFTGFAFDENYNEYNTYVESAVTNVFYWVNLLHDITYIYGFDESAGNFQYQNYGNGGEEEDEMIVKVQYEEFCNASITVPTNDGVSPTMRLYTCEGKDGSFDNTVILHEFAHGLMRRLGGGAGCFYQEERIEEGWCDFYAAMLTTKPTENGEEGKAIANYLFDYGINGPGVRQYPYSTNFNVNPETYASSSNYDSYHKVGAVWGEVMYEVAWALIDEFGYNEDYRNYTGNIGVDAGNIMALAISIEALKFLPCNSGFVDARDAMLEAARAIYGNDIVCSMWPAFAKRGLGFSADQGSPWDKDDADEAFDLPPTIAKFDEEFNLCGIYKILSGLSGGQPFGGVYSGPGVTDHGNGFSYSFNPYQAGPGNHRITYTIDGSPCTSASSAYIVVNVLEDSSAPELRCPGSVLVEVGDYYSHPAIPYMKPLVDFSDNCEEENITLVQDPPPGSIFDVEYPPVIKVTATDASGNESVCEVLMEVNVFRLLSETELELFPNPTSGTVYVRKSSENGFLSATVYDVFGRIVKHYDLRQVESETRLTMENLAIGSYFIRFDLDNEEIVKRLLIEK